MDTLATVVPQNSAEFPRVVTKDILECVDVQFLELFITVALGLKSRIR